jgi:exodeoxyribonuclease-1
LRAIRINAQPLLLPPPPANDLFAMATERERARLVRDHRGFAERVGAALKRRHVPDPDAVPSPWVESRIHDGFPDREDERRRARFHRLGGDERAALARTFGDPRLRALALRQIFLDRPDLLSTEERTECVAWQRERLLADGEVPWTTVAKARTEIAKLAETCPPEKRERLAAVGRYVETLAASAQDTADHQDRAADDDRALDQRGVDAGGEAPHQPARDEGAGQQR